MVWIFLHELNLSENVLTDIPPRCVSGVIFVLLFYVYGYFVCGYVCALCTCLMSMEACWSHRLQARPDVHRSQKRVFDFLGLELENVVVVSLHVDAEN